MGSGLLFLSCKMVFGSALVVESPNVTYTDETITSNYIYQRSQTRIEEDKIVVSPVNANYSFQTQRKVPKLGCMIIGLAGNNGTTVVAGSVANREGISWLPKRELIHQIILVL